MRERNAYLYFHTFDEATFDQLTESLGHAEFNLYQPDTGQIMAIRTEHDIDSDEDLIGDHMPVSKDWLVERIRSRITTSLDWWAADWTTLFCSIHFHETVDELLIGLNGIVGDQLEQRVFDALLSLFKDSIRRGNAVGMIYDPQGVTEDYDWHAFFTESAEAPALLPQLIVVPKDVIPRLALNTDHTESEISGFVIISQR